MKNQPELCVLVRLLVVSGVFVLVACSSQPIADVPETPTTTKADMKARDEFAKTLPKPPEH